MGAAEPLRASGPLALAWLLAGGAACYAPPAAPPLTAAALAAHPAPPRLAPGAGAPADPAGDALPEAAAVAYALHHSPLLRARDDEEAIARAGVAAARQLTNPELRVGRTFEEDAAATSRFVIALRLHPDPPWAMDARISGARARVRAEEAATAVTARAVAARVRQLYARLALAEALRLLMDRQLAALTERARVLGEQLASGRVTRLESLLADQDIAELRDARSKLELGALRDRAELARVIGAPPGRPLTPVLAPAAPEAVRVDFDRRALGDRALAADPALAELAARADAAGAEVYQERAKRVPWLDTLQLERSVRDSVAWGVIATVTLPIFSLNRGRIAVADAQRRRFLGERERLAAETAQRVDAAVDVAEATGRRARELAARFAAADAQIAELLAQDRAAGSSDPGKLLHLEARHAQARREVLEAAYDHRVALIELEALIGSPP